MGYQPAADLISRNAIASGLIAAVGQLSLGMRSLSLAFQLAIVIRSGLVQQADRTALIVVADVVHHGERLSQV